MASKSQIGLLQRERGTTLDDVALESAKVCIVTGANSGIGFETALKMAALDYEVVLACRDAHRGNAAVARIRQQIPECDVSFMQLDLASLKSVRTFVDNFHKTGKKLNVLINNAATICNIRDESPTFTEDGFELTFGVNHLGHFLLTLLLIDDLKKSGPDSRVIIVSSELHNSSSKGHRGSKFPTMDFENIQLLAPGTFDAMLAYKNSKLANVLFSYEFDRNVHGSGLTCNCVAPGFVPQTRLNRRNQIIRCMVIACFRGILRCLPISRSASKAADSIVYVATDDNLQGVGGKYFIDCSVVDSSQESMNREVAEKLWKLSADFVQYDAQKAAESSN